MRSPHRALTRRSALILVAVTVLASGQAVPGTARPASERPSKASNVVQIKALSNRANLISAGDALLEVVLPEGADAADLQVSDDGRDVSGAFARRDDGRVVGLVTGLEVGDNVVTAELPDGRGARITITNHPIGGPVFSGPQLQPWACTTEANDLGPARDEQCNAPTVYRYQYKNTAGQFGPYDPDDPPDDVATTTTDEGNTVPYIVRVERGTVDRSIYEVAVLYDPSQPWEPWASQPGWNHKLYWLFGGGCGTTHAQGSPSSSVINDLGLSRGFMVASSSMTRLGSNCNTTVEAEIVMMTKEHITESYGEIRYTIGDGQSGGAIGQHGIANQYPGLLDGLRPTGSFPDYWSIGTVDGFDCQLLNDYFDNISPTLWPSVAARDAVYGYQEGTVFCHQPLGSYQPEVWDPSTGASCTVPADQVYSAANSEGVRCSLQDYLVAILGTRPQDGFANRMLDNVGLQYGLTALARGSISPEQFVDLNQKIGGWDIDANRQQQRSEADPTALERMYRSGQIVYGTQLEKAAIIDARIGANNDVHSNLQQQITRARIVRANGHHRNHVSWYEPVVAAIGLPTPETMSLTFVKMDEWLSKVEADRSDDPIEIKLARNRPIDVTDACVASGVRVPDESCIAARLYYGDPRIVAGMPLTRDLLKCRLKPLERSDYNVEFTADQWSRLQEAFPTGVCDWSRPGVGQRPNIPWLTYEDGPGGRPLGPPPRSGPFGGPGS